METQLTEDQTENDWLHNLQQLLEDVDSCNKALERPIPTILEWNDIHIIDRKWLLQNWLPENTATLFTGQGGVGKSWLTLQLVCQIASGLQDAFLNSDFPVPCKKNNHDDSLYNPDGPKHILFATYEDEPGEIKKRIQALASSMRWVESELEQIQRHLHIVDMRGIGSIWGPGEGKHVSVTGDLLKAGEDIRTLCEEKKAKLLVLDPLSGAFGGNENDRTAVYDFVSSFRGWSDTAGCAMLLIGHLPKGKEGRAEGFSGSTAWEASVRSMWKLDKKQADNQDGEGVYYSLELTKSNYAAPQSERFLVKSRFGWWQEVETKDEAVEGQKKLEATNDDELTKF